jgi:tetratricopeptide (TPR) repeat protein
MLLLCAGWRAVAAPMAQSTVTLQDFKLTGDLSSESAAFILTATARVNNPRGGTLDLLSGPVALTAIAPNPKVHMRVAQDHYILTFDRRGEFPIQLKFIAAVGHADGWSKLDFHVAPGVLQPVVFRGLAADTQFQFPGAARPDRKGDDFVSFLPADGAVKLSWNEARTETEGKLFFSAEMLAQISFSPGLMRQVALLHCKVMQGELNRVSLRLHGAGEITRVQGEQVLAWNLEAMPNSPDRRLVIQLNQPQKDQFMFQVQAQTPLGAFPQTADALRLSPEDATGFSGCVRIVNDGAVRLEVTQAGGTSQISPEQFPESDATRAAFRISGNQRFAYRFAGADFALRIEADQILPELSASEVLAYHHGENELAIEAEIELDIREAPLRELVLRVPKGYAVAKLNAPSLSDYFRTEIASKDLPAGAEQSELRLVFGQPLSGRQLVELRLEHNQGLGETNWALPRIDIVKATSVRGFVGFSADPGFRLTPERTEALTEIAAAFYPGKLPGIQGAFRLTDAAWAATVRVERLPQTVQADVLNLFSIGEGIAYGSSVINYVVSGAPVASFKIELSNEYDNVEFTGKDIRNWQKAGGGYVVQLHTPVAGAYTLLATYERPFKAQGETLAFTGAHPLDAQSEQGYTLITSAYQFEVKPADISPGLLPLEIGEVPPEYRLFSGAPVLAAYRYAARPFHLTLALSPLAQGDSLNQIVDRASLETRISKEGQAVTSIRYFIKNRGNPHFRLTLPAGAQLWSASVNGVEAVPVSDGAASLIPLPQSADPNAVLELDLKLASPSGDPQRVRVEAPVSDAPVMLAEWKLEPDTGQRLVYEDGSVMPAGGVPDVSGFAQLARLLAGKNWRQSFAHAPADISLLAPVQQAGSTLRVSVLNVANKTTAWTVLGWVWPAWLGLTVWMLGWAASGAWLQFISRVCGWTLLAWAALRIPNGALLFFWVVLAFLLWHGGAPAWRRIRRWSRAPVPATAILAAAGALWLTCGAAICGGADGPAPPDSVMQTIRVEDKFVLGTANIHWQAVQGQSLPLLTSNAVLTHVSYPPGTLELVAAAGGQKLLARKTGDFAIQVQYETRVSDDKGESGFTLPTPSGLIFQLDITIVNLDVDVESPQAVSVQSQRAASNTVAKLVLTPAPAWIGWRPRRRDVTKEKAVFYAEMAQLYVPSAGVIEGAHYVTIRPAQGEVAELLLRMPSGTTVTDVSDPTNHTSLVSLWRFDPDTRQLRVTLNPAQSRPFFVLVRSQAATGPLPLEQSIGLLTVENAAGQIGLAGIATGGEVQLDAVTAPAFSAINLEDFPGDAVAALQGEIPGLTLRRAFRYADTQAGAQAVIALKASAVEPDVRVESEDTLSLGEDHTVLADNLNANITRAGVFDLSFVLPVGFEVESISGAALSQWTESKTEAGRLITLHLLGKTQGEQSFAISLSGPGVKSARDWPAPQIGLREAAKQQGTLLVVPEQGMRLQIATREGYTQLDPLKSGIRQKGVLAFRALQVPARLTLDVEQVDPWIQVVGWQHAVVTEAQVKVSANLQYQIENTGLKSFRLLLPTNAEGVRFEGDQVGDFLAEPGAVTNGMQSWEVKLRRRVIGSYLLQVAYQTLLPAQAAETTLRGIQAADVNLQRGFVTVQSDPRLEVAADPAPPSLQPAEWQSIPRALENDLPAAAATLTYRLVEPSFQLPLKLLRHEAAKLLPARVNNITFNSVVSDDGVMLTQARLEIVPGDKRLLSLTLPPDAKFWFAFVNDNGVWPWRDGGHVLIPLEQQANGGKPATVEVYYAGRAGAAEAHELDLECAAPKFDLPLENITWRISLSDKWRVKHHDGALQLQEEELAPRTDALDAQSYLDSEKSLRQARTQEAQAFLALGNSSLEKGDPQQARRAFQAAFRLSTDDAAFNEDARVQLHNIKLQQALIGFNARQSGAAGDTSALGGKLRDLRNRQELNYTQQEAKDIIDINTADDNAAFVRLAEKLIQQQDAAVVSPAAIRASIPEQGQLLTFHRAVAVDAWADLKIGLQARLVRTASMGMRLLILAGACLVFAVLGATFSRFAVRPEALP